MICGVGFAGGRRGWKGDAALSRPVLLTVDDEPQVLNAIDRDLRRQYGKAYRVVKATSGAEALQAIQELKRRNQVVALLLADQRMPAMSGTEFLAEAIKLYPEAVRVLLTAYADTAAAITSINSLGLDYYLMKPWDPPDQHLYPVLNDLLDEWQAKASPPEEGLRVAGTLWSAASHTVKEFLARNQIPYQWLDIEKDETARRMAADVWGDKQLLPVVFFPEGGYQIAPTIRELAERIGLQTNASKPFYDLVIIGAGPAGLAAAVYGASEGLRTVMIEREASGGQAGTSARIENYLGFPKGISGGDLTRRAVAQALRFGAEILTTQEASQVVADGSYRIVKLSDGAELRCHALLVATGVSVRKLEVPGCERLTGAGVYYGAALAEAALFRGQDVIVVGGGNSAGQGALFLARYAGQVKMLVRGGTLSGGMSRYLIDQVLSTPNIEVQFNTEILEVAGGQRLESVVTCNKETGEVRTQPAAAMFLFIGAVPRAGLVSGLVAMDRVGFILTGPSLVNDGKRPPGWPLKRDPYLLETSLPGVFAAGDVRHSSIKRVASAVGEGAVAVQLIHQYLRTV